MISLLLRPSALPNKLVGTGLKASVTQPHLVTHASVGLESDIGPQLLEPVISHHTILIAHLGNRRRHREQCYKQLDLFAVTLSHMDASRQHKASMQQQQVPRQAYVDSATPDVI
jgi:hypothetical protein